MLARLSASAVLHVRRSYRRAAHFRDTPMVRTTSKYNPELEAIGSEIVKRLGGVWKPGGAMCRCPAHADRSPSLSVRVGDHALLFKCFRSEEHTSELQSLMRISYAVFCLKKKTQISIHQQT